MSNLVIVESAAKAKTIQKYLNSDPSLKDMGSFAVIASLGHIVDLPSKSMGIDTSTWTPEYQPLDTKKKTIAALKSAVKEAKNVFLASDPDLEGESIANHLKNVLKLKSAKRITFHEITKKALVEAIKNPRQIDMSKVAAQETRRILDRLVGYELSPLLWNRFEGMKGLSAGRVQSAALRMVVEKWRAMQDHTPSLFWKLAGVFEGSDMRFDTVTDGALETKEAARGALESLRGVTGWHAVFAKKEVRRSPPAPFTTSTLQQEAYSTLGFNAKRTMQVAQELYEAGHITYMRTDSTGFAEEAQAAMLRMIADKYGDDMAKARQYKTTATNAQEAHEAIRPTSFDSEPVLEGPAKKLYDLIWRRAVASQMAPAVYCEITYKITSPDSPHEFTGKDSILISPGHLCVSAPNTQTRPVPGIPDSMPVKAQIFEARADITRPAPLYNEPGLVKALEKKGVGRPSTYATIMDKLFEKGYVTRGPTPVKEARSCNVKLDVATRKIESTDIKLCIGTGNDKDKLIPTCVGEQVTDYLMSIVPNLVDVGFTAQIEASMDQISEGRVAKNAVLDDFYKPFSEVIKPHKSRPRTTSATCSEKPHVKSTKYGPAVYDPGAHRFVSLEAFLTWRKCPADAVSDADMRFLLSFPISLPGTDKTIEWGRYGIYAKEGGENLMIPKQHWDRIYDGSMTAADLEASCVRKKSR